MGEITANSRPIYKRPLGGGFGIAHADNVIDVAVDPLRYRHDLSHPIAGPAELTLREPHELVGGAEAAGQQKRQDLTRKVGPNMLTTGWGKQLPEVILNYRAVPDGNITRERSPHPSVAVGGGVGEDLRQGVNVERFRKNDLVAR